MTENEWDALAKINKTDLYGLLDIMLERLGQKGSAEKALCELKYKITKDDALDSLERCRSALGKCPPMSRMHDHDVYLFRKNVINAVHEAIAEDTRVALIMPGAQWAEDFVHRVIYQYKDFVTLETENEGRGPVYTLYIVSKVEQK